MLNPLRERKEDMYVPGGGEGTSSVTTACREGRSWSSLLQGELESKSK